MISFDFARPVTLPLQMHADGKHYVLQDTVSFPIGVDRCPLVVTIPAGYRADMESIPPGTAFTGFERLGAHCAAALVHDFMYTNQCGYELSNTVLYTLLRKLGMSNLKAGWMAFWCEAGGKTRYKRHGLEAAQAQAQPGSVI